MTPPTVAKIADDILELALLLISSGVRVADADGLDAVRDLVAEECGIPREQAVLAVREAMIRRARKSPNPRTRSMALAMEGN